MKVEIYEADPFTQRKDKLLTTLSTDYRFQKGDEIFIEEGGRSVKVWSRARTCSQRPTRSR